MSSHPSVRGMARVVEEEGHSYSSDGATGGGGGGGGGDGGNSSSNNVSPAVSAGEAVNLNINGQIREVAIPNSVSESPVRHGGSNRGSPPSNGEEGGGGRRSRSRSRSPGRHRTQL